MKNLYQTDKILIIKSMNTIINRNYKTPKVR